MQRLTGTVKPEPSPTLLRGARCIRRIAAMVLVTASPCFAQSQEPPVADVLLRIAREINPTLPLQIDKEKVLEVTAAVRNTLIFKYKFTDERTINDPRWDREKYIAALRLSLGQSTCSDSATFALLVRGARYNYLFTTRAGRQVVDFTLDAAACRDLRRNNAPEEKRYNEQLLLAGAMPTNRSVIGRGAARLSSRLRVCDARSRALAVVELRPRRHHQAAR